MYVSLNIHYGLLSRTYYFSANTDLEIQNWLRALWTAAADPNINNGVICGYVYTAASEFKTQEFLLLNRNLLAVYLSHDPSSGRQGKVSLFLFSFYLKTKTKSVYELSLIEFVSVFLSVCVATDSSYVCMYVCMYV